MLILSAITLIINNLYDYDSFILIIAHVLNVYIFYIVSYNLLKKIKFNYINYLSNYSFFIYLTHIIINSFIIKFYNFIFGDFLLTEVFSFVVLNLLFFTLSIIISISIAKILEKKFNKIYSILVGNRIKN